MQPSLRAKASHERDRFAVRRRSWSARSAGAGDVGLGFTLLQIEPFDRVDLPVRILVVLKRLSRCGVLRVVKVLAIGREHRLVDILLIVRPLRQLDSGHGVQAGGVAVVHPHFPRAQRTSTGEMLASNDVLIVGRPRRSVEQSERLVGDLPKLFRLSFDDPDVVARLAVFAVSVAGEGNPVSVVAEARLKVPGNTGCEFLWRSFFAVRP